MELGVGTARVAIHLAKAGLSVLGLDSSVHMLGVAEQKLAEENEAVRGRIILMNGDMRDFRLNQSFPFIYIPASTFDHNATVKEQRQTLGCIYKHLEKNGTFAFDLEQALSDRPNRSWWIDRKVTDSGRLVVRSIFTRRDPAKQICCLDLFFDVYEDGKMLERYHEFGEVAMISKDSIVDLLEEVGFSVQDVYGDFDKSEYQGDSPRIVLVTKKY